MEPSLTSLETLIYLSPKHHVHTHTLHSEPPTESNRTIKRGFSCKQHCRNTFPPSLTTVMLLLSALTMGWHELNRATRQGCVYKTMPWGQTRWRQPRSFLPWPPYRRSPDQAKTQEITLHSGRQPQQGGKAGRQKKGDGGGMHGFKTWNEGKEDEGIRREINKLGDMGRGMCVKGRWRDMVGVEN